MRLANRTALITGAGGPMGEAIAARFAEEGASLVITDISANRLQAATARIEPLLQSGTALFAMRADVRNRRECDGLVEGGRARLGTIDILVNVVGGVRDAELFRPFLEMTETRWDDTFTLNLKGSFHLIQLTAAAMIENRYGRIVNFASINMAGEARQSDYGAAKAAVASLTRSLAMEFAPFVNVNAVAPGTIRTSVMQRQDPADSARYAGRTLLKRAGDPREVAHAVLFLASEEASYITGETLTVSGGIPATL
jgi:NAD(P)-dependent dehydrogenase (short-subunit alcohol dehydrogenase family)